VDQFGHNAYHIVHGENCIDHTVNPLQAIEQMLSVSKPQGFVVLRHAENEGHREQYRQLHQWDFTWESGCFVRDEEAGCFLRSRVHAAWRRDPHRPSQEGGLKLPGPEAWAFKANFVDGKNRRRERT
jgi:hypothetical protein